MSSTNGIGVKRCSRKPSERTRQRREAARIELEAEQHFYGETAREAPKSGVRSVPRPAAIAVACCTTIEPVRRMPWGLCSGCGDDPTPLPHFGGGLCFICATDGPPGEYTSAGGALDEDSDARREEASDWHEAGDLEDQIRDEFAEAGASAGSKLRWRDLHAEVVNEFETLAAQYEGAITNDSIRAVLGTSKGERVPERDIRRSWAAIHEAWKAAGCCIWCGQPRGLDGTQTHCRVHADLENERSRRHAARAAAVAHGKLLAATCTTVAPDGDLSGLAQRWAATRAKLPARVTLPELRARIASIPEMPRTTGNGRSNNVLPRHKQIGIVAWLMNGMSGRWTAQEMGVDHKSVHRLRHRWETGREVEVDADARAVLQGRQFATPPPPYPEEPPPPAVPVLEPEPPRKPHGFVELDGKLVRLTVVCAERQLNYHTVKSRLRNGWSLGDALRKDHKLLGKVFGRLTILTVTVEERPVATCRCSCGAMKKVSLIHLRGKNRNGRPSVLSCGCLHLEIISGGAAPTHVVVYGERISMGELGVLAGKSPTSIWAAMRRGASPEEAAFGHNRMAV